MTTNEKQYDACRSWKMMSSTSFQGLKAMACMVVVQAGFAAVNVFYKLAAADGMDLRILVAYRLLFAVAFILPLAFYFERKKRRRITWSVLVHAFFCGLFGGALLHNLYLKSLTLTSATYASAMNNLVPAITFVLAVSFRLEKLRLGTLAGQAKVVGTLITISGAMVLTLYKGFEINLWSTHILLINQRPLEKGSTTAHVIVGNQILGALSSLGGSLAYGFWLIFQTRLSDMYPSYYSSTALMNMMGGIQAIAYALMVDHTWEDWKLGWNIRLATVAFAGTIGSGAIVVLIAWCVNEKGPLFVSTFSPLMLILVAIAGSLFLDEKLYLGSLIGATLIVCGLYAVLWGKAKEAELKKIVVTSFTCLVEDGNASKVDDSEIN
ncbi:hypothetical protein V2J09_017853 [Rumex salicifolius]